MKRITFITHINDGKLPPLNVSDFNDQDVQVRVEPIKKGRSGLQNAYLWGVVYDHALQGFVAEGYDDITIDDVHEFFKKEFLPGATIHEVIVPRSTRHLTTQEMTEYIDMISRFCGEWFGIVIPEPVH